MLVFVQWVNLLGQRCRCALLGIANVSGTSLSAAPGRSDLERLRCELLAVVWSCRRCGYRTRRLPYANAELPYAQKLL
jgi:hypothetical protein